MLSTLLASSFLGWSISRLRILPGSTAVWGSAPGGATAMVLMAEAFGADARLVAFMQYLRVVMVTLAAAFVARLWVDPSAMVAPERAWFPPLDWPALAATLLVAAVAGRIGKLLRLPSPYFIGAALIAHGAASRRRRSVPDSRMAEGRELYRGRLFHRPEFYAGRRVERAARYCRRSCCRSCC